MGLFKFEGRIYQKISNSYIIAKWRFNFKNLGKVIQQILGFGGNKKSIQETKKLIPKYVLATMAWYTAQPIKFVLTLKKMSEHGENFGGFIYPSSPRASSWSDGVNHPENRFGMKEVNTNITGWVWCKQEYIRHGLMLLWLKIQWKKPRSYSSRLLSLNL